MPRHGSEKGHAQVDRWFDRLTTPSPVQGPRPRPCVWLGMALGLIVLLGMAVGAEERGTLALSADFENGSLGEWELVAPDTVRLTLTKASGGLWFHFHIQGVKGRTITFVIPMTVALDRIVTHYYDKRNRPAYSYDRKQWELAEPGRLDREAKTFTFQVTFRQEQAWVAYCIPYTNDTLDALLEEHADSPHLSVRTLATTAGGRPVRWLVIGEEPDDPEPGIRRTVWIIARESGWEAPASWAADGFARFALGAGEASRRFRQRLIANVVPIVSPDAVAGGWMRHPTGGDEHVYLPMGYGKDYPEITGLRGAVRDWMAKGNTIDFSLRFHSFGWLSTQHEFRQEQYLPGEQVEFDGLADRFHRLVPEVRWTRGHLFPGLGFVEFCYRNFQIKGGTLTLGLGAKDNQMTQADLQDVGQALGEVLLSLYAPEPLSPGAPAPMAR